MKYALIADVHSNLEALDAILAHARGVGVDNFALLGDVVGYGADPQAVVERCAALVEAGAPAVLGNHDAAACRRYPMEMNADAQTAIEWTRTQLQPSHLEWLARLPLILREDDITLVHSSAIAPEEWLYVSSGIDALASVAAAGTRYVFSGHVHDPALFYLGRDGRMFAFRPTEGVPVPVPRHRYWLAIVGSAGQPRDGKIGARYAIFDSRTAQLTFYRVPYDHTLAAAKIRAAGLPERLARHVEGTA